MPLLLPACVVGDHIPVGPTDDLFQFDPVRRFGSRKGNFEPTANINTFSPWPAASLALVEMLLPS